MFHSFTSDTKMWSSCGTHTKITNNVSRLSAGHRLIPRVFEAKSWSSSVHTSLKYFKYNWYMIQDIRLWYTTCHKISGSDTRHATRYQALIHDTTQDIRLWYTTRHKISGSDTRHATRYQALIHDTTQDIRLWYTTRHKISGSDTRHATRYQALIHDTTRHDTRYQALQTV